MGVPEKKPMTSSTKVMVGRNTLESVNNTFTDELVIGLCAPIGCLKKELIRQISVQLQTDYGYKVELIKLSEFLQINFKAVSGETNSYTNRRLKIEKGDALRESSGRNSILVDMAIRKIHGFRVEGVELNEKGLPDPEKMRSKRVCYIIDSVKNLEEVKVLQSIYRDIYYQFSVYTPLHERKRHLRADIEEFSEKGTKGNGNQDESIVRKPSSTALGLSNKETEAIIKLDDFEHDKRHAGQNVRYTFLEGDFFTRITEHTTRKEISEKVKRYLNIIFEAEVVTPFPEEVAMYAAQSAAVNSACMSRQVGASITDARGNILAIGWNDVPRYGGGLYESNLGEGDKRCFRYGQNCRNDLKKDEISEQLVAMLVNSLDERMASGLALNAKQQKAYNVLRKNLQQGWLQKIRNESYIKELIEFSRAVHAEMHAMINAAQRTGSAMIGGTLYCTTYPCHNCARHLLAAGIDKVYYIEPYEKSLSAKLHDDAITESEEKANNGMLKILVYDGVSPRRFLNFFKKTTARKVNGESAVNKKVDMSPKNRISLQALSILEQQAVIFLQKDETKAK